MAGDWIAMRTDLWECPQVVRILSAMCPKLLDKCPEMSNTLRTRNEIIGALHRTWSLFDRYSDDGTMVGYTAEALNDAVGIENWAENLQHVGWLVIDTQSLTMPQFESWMSESSKRRMKDSRRKRQERKNVSEICPKVLDKTRTTGQDRREENTPPISPKGESSVIEAFETFWAAYPSRNGKRVGKAKTQKLWKNLSEFDQRAAQAAAENYANSKQATSNYAKDPERFLKDRFWEDWLDGPGDSSDAKQKTPTAEDLANWTPE